MAKFEAVFSIGFTWPTSDELLEAVFKKNSLAMNLTCLYPGKMLVVGCDKRPVDLRRYGIRWKEIE